MSKISVCLPVYNGARFVAQAISSVLSQSCEDFELLVVDDASQDDSYAIIQQLAQQDPRIKASRNEANVGLFTNYNKCIEQSRGEYIKFFAQDDILHPDSLAVSVRTLQENPTVSLVATRRVWIGENGQGLSDLAGTASNLYVPANCIVAGHEVIRQSLSQCTNFIGEPSTVCVRKPRTFAGFDCRYHHLGDLDLWLRILRSGDYYYVDEPLTSVRIHENSRSVMNMSELLFAPDMVRLLGRFEDLLPEFGDTYEIRLQSWARRLCWHVEHLVHTKQLSAASLRSSADSKYRQLVEAEVKTRSDHDIVGELLAFRELLFYVCRDSKVLTSNAPRSKAASRSANITGLETKLRKLLQSPSWRATRWLRELNSSITGPATFSVSRRSEYVDADAYTNYLRQEISRIKGSRSWRLTRQLRRLGML